MSKPNGEIVVSGVRPTGNLHLGNYFGAVRNFAAMQSKYDCTFFIADLHSLTTHPTPEGLQNAVRQIMAEYLACGIDPEQSTIYVQSDLPETVELYLLLNMNAYLGELQRCSSFKEKVRKNPNNVNAGLLTYPTLMAADILIHRAAYVPVGKDQEQHLEMTRTFALRFNRMYNTDLFPEPKAYADDSPMVKIPSLNGTGKMGKSEGNAIYLADAPDEIRKKVKRAVSDSGPTVPGQPKSEPIENLFTLLRAVSTEETVAFFEEAYNNCSIRYGDMKQQLAEDIITLTEPIRERIEENLARPEKLSQIARQGADKARRRAKETLQLAREAVGILPL